MSNAKKAFLLAETLFCFIPLLGGFLFGGFFVFNGIIIALLRLRPDDLLFMLLFSVPLAIGGYALFCVYSVFHSASNPEITDFPSRSKVTGIILGIILASFLGLPISNGGFPYSLMIFVAPSVCAIHLLALCHSRGKHPPSSANKANQAGTSQSDAPV